VLEGGRIQLGWHLYSNPLASWVNEYGIRYGKQKREVDKKRLVDNVQFKSFSGCFFAHSFSFACTAR
jgi:hypothetical protein